MIELLYVAYFMTYYVSFVSKPRETKQKESNIDKLPLFYKQCHLLSTRAQTSHSWPLVGKRAVMIHICGVKDNRKNVSWTLFSFLSICR